MPKAVRFHKLGGPEVLRIEEVQVRPSRSLLKIDLVVVAFAYFCLLFDAPSLSA